MKRRNFLKKIPVAMSVPFAINGITMKAMADNPLARLAQLGDEDKVLIILQMHGGNDGINSLIPIEAYDQYYSKRPNIAIPQKKYLPLDFTLPAESQTGLHPSMQAMKEMYDEGRMAFVQGVSYKNNNGSHFRGRDIWFMGGGSDDYFSSGWLGRYLGKEYEPLKYPEDFPNDEMLDPLALEMGLDTSLIFHQENNIPTSISIQDVEGFDELVDGLEGFKDLVIDVRGLPPTPLLEPSPYWQELNWILELEDKTKDYAKRLADVYSVGSKKASTVTYPENYPFNAPQGSKKNPLARQLQTISKLLDGGCKTKVFMVKIGGFDTHADQVEAYDTTMGVHAALMYHISTAMKSFQEDLRERGLEDRVLTVSTSEFGRRIYSNGSFGTDHGTGGPIYVFGKGVKPGMNGVVPDLTKGNVELQFDYRQVYANLLQDWMGVSKEVINNDIFFKNFIDGEKEDGSGTYEPLVLASQVITGTGDFVSSRFILEDCYPNPAQESTTLHFKTNSSGLVTVNLYDNAGKKVKALINENFEAGEHHRAVDLKDISVGHYIYQFKSGTYKQTKKLVIVR